MVLAKDLASGGSGQGSPFARVAFHGDRSFAEATLQAKHIRIDA
jgi:hypothetical protein